MRRWKKGRRGSTLLAALSHVAIWSLLLPSFVPVAEAAIVTVNVDNANGDEQTGVVPAYGGTWTSVSASRPCTSRFCPLQPDVNSAFGDTYHYGVSTSNFDDSVTVTINFRGTSVRVFFITFTGSDFDTFAHFTLDGIDRTTFLNGQRAPFSSPFSARFQFDRVVFELEGLTNTEHTLVIGSKASNNFTNVLLFDRMQYRFDDAALPTSRTTSSSTSTSSTSTSTQIVQTVVTTATIEPTPTSGSDSGSLATSPPSPYNSKSNAGKIIGGVIGGVAALALIAAFALFNFVWYNRRKRKDHFGPYTRRDAVLGDESSVVEEQNFQSSPFVGGSETRDVATAIRPASFNGRPTVGRSYSDYRRSGPPTVMSSIRERPLSYAQSLSSHHSHGRRSSHGHLSSIGHNARYSFQNSNHPYNPGNTYNASNPYASNPYNPNNHPYNPNGPSYGNNNNHSTSTILLSNILPSIPQEDPVTPPFGFPTSKRVSPVGSEESISSLPQHPNPAMTRRVSSASSAHEIASIRAQIHRLEYQLDRLADTEHDVVSVIPEAGESEHNPPAYPGRPRGLQVVDLPGRTKEPLLGGGGGGGGVGESRSWTSSENMDLRSP